MSKARSTGNIGNIIKTSATCVTVNDGTTDLLIMSGSGRVTIPGNLVVLGGISGSSAESSSYSLSSSFATNANLLDGIDGASFLQTGSFNTFSSSIDTTIKNKLNGDGVISGSVQVDITNTTGYSTFSSSLSSSIGSLSGSVATTTSGLSSSIGSLSSSVATTTSGLASRIGSVETKTGSYATTGSNVFIGSQVITGSLYITNDMIVQGCSCLQNITASAVSIGTNVVMLNTATPAVRFAGISVQDSGSNAGVTGSIYWDGLCNKWIYSNPSDIGYSGGMLISGPRSSTLGSEAPLTCNYIAKSGGGDHIYDSCIIDDGTTVCINANLKGSGTACFGNTITVSSTNGGTSAIFANSGAQNSNGIELRGGSAGTAINWKLEKDNTIANAFQITPSSTAGGTTYTTPSFTLTSAGISCFAGRVCMSSLTINGTSFEFNPNANAGAATSRINFYSCCNANSEVVTMYAYNLAATTTNNELAQIGIGYNPSCTQGYINLYTKSSTNWCTTLSLVNGNVGIGISTPSAGLHVISSGRLATLGNGITFTSTNTAQAWMGSENWGWAGSAWSRTSSSPAVIWGTGNNSGAFEVWTALTSDTTTTAPTNSNSKFIITNAGVSCFASTVCTPKVISTHLSATCLTLNGFSSGNGFKMDYGNASGQITAINLMANGTTNGFIGIQMVDGSNGDLWLGSSANRSMTIYRTGNHGFKTDTPCTSIHVEGGYGSKFGCNGCFYGGGYAGGGFPYGDQYGNGSAYTYQTCFVTAIASNLFGGYAAGYFKGGDGGSYGGGGAGIVAIGGNGANSEGVNSGGGAGLFARGGLNGTGSAISYAGWFDGGDVIIRCGNVGIGSKCTPNAPLDVTSASSSSSGIQQWSYNTSPNSYRLQLNTMVCSGLVRYSFDMLNAGASYNCVLTIDRGNVGIGESCSNVRLYVNQPTAQGASTPALRVSYIGGGNGNSQVVGMFTNDATLATSSYLYIGSYSGSDWYIGKNVAGTSSNYNFQLGISTNNILGTLTTGGAWSTTGGGTSDRRVKKDITPISQNALSFINELNPVSFKFKEDCAEKTRRGFIAQDILETSIPSLVLGDGDQEGGTYGLDYDGILSLAVKALQEAMCRIEILESCLGIN